MRRKIVQQGPTTLMVSLPIHWVNKFGLKKGGELELEEVGSRIIIHSEGKFVRRETEINLFSEEGLYIWRILQSLYLSGYSQIKISFKSRKTLDLIQDSVTNSLIGFEIVSHDKNSCLVKQVSSEINEEFDVVLKRVFQNVLQMSEILMSYLNNSEKLESLMNLERTNNRHTIYLKRIIIQENKHPSYYYIADLLEKIANEYKFISIDLKKKENVKKFVDVYRKIDEGLNEIYSIFFENSDKIEEVISKGIRSESLVNYFKYSGILTHHLMNINYFARSILSQIMVINKKEDETVKK